MGTRQKTVNFTNNLILQLLTYYSYEDIKIVMFTNEKNKKDWEYLKYLNHNFTNRRDFRFFSSDYDSAKNIIDAQMYNFFSKIPIFVQNKFE